MSEAFIDVEASSFRSFSYPLEVGISLSGGTEKKWRIAPLPHWVDWCPGAQKVHGIARSELIRTGLSPFRVASEINSSLSGRRVICGSDFDVMWLHCLFNSVKCDMAFELVSLPHVEGLPPAVVRRIFSALDVLKSHSSVDDARNLRHLYFKYAAHARNQHRG